MKEVSVDAKWTMGMRKSRSWDRTARGIRCFAWVGGKADAVAVWERRKEWLVWVWLQEVPSGG